jgi:hypothetical protein
MSWATELRVNDRGVRDAGEETRRDHRRVTAPATAESPRRSRARTGPVANKKPPAAFLAAGGVSLGLGFGFLGPPHFFYGECVGSTLVNGGEASDTCASQQ